jgi:hypothetical protein
MAKYGRKASQKVERTMRERKRGTLRSGSGQKVRSRKQAIAIGLSEARREGGKVPSRGRKKTGGRKKAGGRKTGGQKRSSARKTGGRSRRSSGSRKK